MDLLSCMNRVSWLLWSFPVINTASLLLLYNGKLNYSWTLAKRDMPSTISDPFHSSHSHLLNRFLPSQLTGLYLSTLRHQPFNEGEGKCQLSTTLFQPVWPISSLWSLKDQRWQRRDWLRVKYVPFKTEHRLHFSPLLWNISLGFQHFKYFILNAVVLQFTLLLHFVVQRV